MSAFLTGAFLATLVAALFATRLYRLLMWYALNSLALGLLALLIGSGLNDPALIISGVLTLLLKAGVIPLVLKRLTQRFALTRQVTPDIKVHYAVVLIPAILVFTFYLAEPIGRMVGGNANSVAVAISSLFLALLLMMEHRNVAPKIIGFLMMENALFLLGTTATGGMPMLVELGIFFDLLIAIVVINLLFRREEAVE